MAKTALIMKQQRPPKFKSRAYTRCKICGRPRGFLRKFQTCRICFRELALKGEVPGVIKASWYRHVQRSDRRLPDPHPQREPRRAREGGHPVVEAQAAHGRDPEGRG